MEPCVPLRPACPRRSAQVGYVRLRLRILLQAQNTFTGVLPRLFVGVGPFGFGPRRLLFESLVLSLQGVHEQVTGVVDAGWPIQKMGALPRQLFDHVVQTLPCEG